ncbi:MAG: hypothetical protein IJX62_09635 [Clostridia bacterium]|nr:hypothetical protein [Clostridia bacterium]
MENLKPSAPPVWQARHDAAQVLARRGNRLLMIECWMVVLLSVLLYQTLSNLSELVGMTGAWGVALLFAFALSAALTLFFVLPLFLGMLGMAAGIVNGQEMCLAELFAPFASGRAYRRALGLSFALLWRGTLLFLVVACTYGLFVALTPGSWLGGLLCGVLILAELTVGLLLCLRSFSMIALAYQYPQQPLREIRRRTAILRRAYPSAGIRFFSGFLPWILLGLLTVGILLLADVLPRMCVAYFQYCNQMTERLIRLEEGKNHE